MRADSLSKQTDTHARYNTPLPYWQRNNRFIEKSMYDRHYELISE